jgi:hypothetical protein
MSAESEAREDDESGVVRRNSPFGFIHLKMLCDFYYFYYFGNFWFFFFFFFFSKLSDERLKDEQARLVAKYGRELSKDAIRRKLIKKRRYFDSAEYFSRLANRNQGDVAAESDENRANAIPVLVLFKRAPEGFVKHSTTPITTILAPPPTAAATDGKPARSHFDSADWSMSLAGFLEYPLGEKPHPVMLYFTQDKVGIAPHPLSKLSDNASAEADLAEMCEQADEELRSRYGENFKLSPAQRLKIKLRGKKKRFDSADWAISLQSEHQENDN